MSITRKYCSIPGVMKAQERITNPPNGQHYEHHVGSWANTMFARVFTEDHWIITPEQIDIHSGKKPDLMVEKLTGDTLRLHLVCELKSSVGDSIKQALIQLKDSITITLDQIGYDDHRGYDIFAIVQKGTKIAFFTYHTYVSMLFEKGVVNYEGFVPLHWRGNIQIPRDMESLPNSAYDTPGTDPIAIFCIYDIRRHPAYVNELFEFVKTHDPFPGYDSSESSRSE